MASSSGPPSKPHSTRIAEINRQAQQLLDELDAIDRDVQDQAGEELATLDD